MQSGIINDEFLQHLANIAEEFTKHYYRTFDADRAALKGLYVREHALLRQKGNRRWLTS